MDLQKRVEAALSDDLCHSDGYHWMKYEGCSDCEDLMKDVIKELIEREARFIEALKDAKQECISLEKNWDDSMVHFATKNILPIIESALKELGIKEGERV